MNFYQKTTPQLLEHVGLQNMKVGGKTNDAFIIIIYLGLLEKEKQLAL